MVTLRTKKVLSVLFTVAASLCGAWFVRAAYERTGLLLPALLLSFSVAAQVLLSLARTTEDDELEKLRSEVQQYRKERDVVFQAQMSQFQQVLETRAQIIEQIRAGNLAGAKEWRDLL